MKINPREMTKSFCRLLIQVNHAFVAIFNVANMSFNAIRENRFSPKFANLQYFVLFTVWFCELRSAAPGNARIR